MANDVQNNTSIFSWVVIIAAIVLLGKTCRCGDDGPSPTYSYSSTPSLQAAWSATNTQPEQKRPKASKVARAQRRRIPASTRHLTRGPRGGCYYINDNGNKIYVDRSLCN